MYCTVDLSGIKQLKNRMFWWGAGLKDKNYIEAYCQRISADFISLANLSGDIAEVVQILETAIQNGSKILLCGNGGSAADAQHIAAELLGRFKRERRAQPALALTTDTSILTAVGNDYDFTEIFSRQVEAHGAAGDVLIAISTSGNSQNIVKAAEKARDLSVMVVGLTGSSGGALADQCDHMVRVPSDETSHIQEMHIAVGHMVCALVESRLE